MVMARSGARGADGRGFTVGEMIFLVGVLAVFIAGTVVVVGEGVDHYRSGSSEAASADAQVLMDRLDAIIGQARAFYLYAPAGSPTEAAVSGGALVLAGDLDGDGTMEQVVLHAAGGGRVLAADVRAGGAWKVVELTDGLDPGAAEPFAASLETGSKTPAPFIETVSAGDEVTAVRYTVRLVGEKGPRTYSRTVSFEKPVSVEESAP